MQSIARISSSVSEPWVAWTMVVLLVLLVLADSLQRGVIINSFRGLRTAKERDNLFNITTSNPIGHLFLECYKVGIFALTLYTLLAPQGAFCYIHFWLIAACVVGVLMAKYLIAILLSYVFFSNKVFQIAVRHYVGITTCCAIALYPLLLFMLFVPQMGTIAMYILGGTVGIFYIIVLLMKIFQFFFTQPLASVHIFLYLCTLEALPLVGLFYVGYELIN